MDPDPDEVSPPEYEKIQWLTKENVQRSVPSPQYSILTEQARQFISLEKQCILFCGGRNCKYERADCWPEQMAIKGLFSNWVTDNILAMARPNTAALKEFNIIKQFKDANIKTLINLQESGEHASCGPGLEDSGFSYNPQTFMDSDIYFYNFGCPDFGASSNGTILDIVRVMQFAMSEGKVAIHCHAGLGRTGFYICAYLVFTNRMSANEAIHYVREKRERSIQTRRQIQCLKNFADYLQQLWIVCTDGTSCEFTLQQYLSRQRKLLHGYEARKLKYIPKIIYFVCERLLELAERGNSLSAIFSKGKSVPSSKMSVDLKTTEKDLSKSQAISKRKTSRHEASSSESTLQSKFMKDFSLPSQLKGDNELNDNSSDKGSEKENKSVVNPPQQNENTKEKKANSFVADLQTWWQKMAEIEVNCLKARAIAIALSEAIFEDTVIKRRNDYKEQLNSNDMSWKLLAKESDPLVLIALLWDWLNRLKEPVLRYTDWKGLLSYISDPLSGLATLEKGPHTILDYLSKVTACLLPLPEKLINRLLEILLSHLTHHYVIMDHIEPLQQCKDWLDLEPFITEQLLYFFKSLIRINYKNLSEKKINSPLKG